jgi:thiamine transport system permease protein
MLSVIQYSFTQRQGWAGEITYTFRWYRQILFGGGERSVIPYTRALLNSLFYGIMTVAFSLPIGTALAYATTRKKFPGRHASESLLMLPLGVSAVILGLGYLRAFRGFPFPVHGRWYAIALVHTVIAIPFVIRAISAVMKKIQPSVQEAARSLGAGAWKLFWHIELPLLKPGILTAAAFAFALSIGEVTATLMLTRADLITLPIGIYRLIGSYQFQAACAMGTVVMLVSLAAFLIIDRLGEEVW